MTRETFYKGQAHTLDHLYVASIFETVDGETNAYHAGTWSVFIRLQGCRVGCRWCFGIKRGKRVPRVTLAQPQKGSTKKRLDCVEVGDTILTLDDAHNLVETTVTDLHRRHVNEWYEIDIDKGKGSGVGNGRGVVQYYVTPEHPVSTVRGWVEAKDLVVGDVLFQVEPPELLSHFKRGARNPNYDRATYQPNYRALKERLSKGEGECTQCAAVTKLEVHHKDGNDTNDSQDNLAALCHRCHSVEHRRGFNFWNGERRDQKVSTTCAEINHNGATVIASRRVFRDPQIVWRASQGMRDDIEVFNLTCEPHNTYLLDRMWVHNCDTKYSWPIDKQGKHRTPLEIMDILRFSSARKVTITGGEPMEQWGSALQALLRQLIAANYVVSMETSGCDPLFPVIEAFPQVNLIVDYKLASAAVTRPVVEENFKYLRQSDVVKFVCTLQEVATIPYIVGQLRAAPINCLARCVFSPVWQEHAELQSFVETARQHRLPHLNVGLNLQMHKFIWPQSVRDEEGVSAL